MKSSEQIDQIAKAMSIAQGEMKPASKSTVNPFFKSTYSSLSQVMDSIREPFARNNLCIFQDVSSTELGVAVSTRICHASGQWIEVGPMVVPLVKKDPQAVGSATSYGKRYSLSAAVGVVSELEDDDSESAMDRNQKVNQTKPKPASLPVISSEQVEELQKICDQCDPDYIAKVMGYLEQQGVKGFTQVKIDMYNKILKGMIQNSEEYVRR